MIADLDVYRAADELIAQRGEDAPIRAAMRPLLARFTAFRPNEGSTKDRWYYSPAIAAAGWSTVRSHARLLLSADTTSKRWAMS